MGTRCSCKKNGKKVAWEVISHSHLTFIFNLNYRFFFISILVQLQLQRLIVCVWWRYLWDKLLFLERQVRGDGREGDGGLFSQGGVAARKEKPPAAMRLSTVAFTAT